MKKLAIIALAALTSFAYADNRDRGDRHNDESEVTSCDTCPAIVIDGKSTQAVAATSSFFLNLADGQNAYARQNVSSNSGNVTIKSGARSTQLTATKGSAVANLALGTDAYASQNVSSNVGNVTIKGWSTQITALKHSAVLNVSTGKNRAVQNLASNNGCDKCN